MMKITSITRLRDCGIFRDFTWINDLPEFARYNLIYGWNGTGKTTISRIFRALELRIRPDVGQVTIGIDNKDIQGDDFPNFTIPIRVFNRDFINENVFRLDGADLPGIFMVGKENIEKQQILENLKRDLAEEQRVLVDAQARKQNANRNLDRFCIDRAKSIKDTLLSPGPNPYNNYDKSDYRRQAELILKEGGARSPHFTEDDRNSLLSQCRATQKSKVETIKYHFPDLSALAQKTTKLLLETVVSKVIETLKNDTELAKWTRDGLLLHKKRNSEQCLFCGQNLPNDYLSNLEAHFSTEYENFIDRIDEQIKIIKLMLDEASKVSVHSNGDIYDFLASEYDNACKAFKEALNTMNRFLNQIQKLLENKKYRIFESLTERIDVPVVDAQSIDRLNEVIQRHNQSCDNFQQCVESARESLANDMIAQSIEEFVRLKNEADQATTDEQSAQQKIQQLNKNISLLEREIIQHRKPAEDLNQELASYLGHDELRLEIKETGYAITRKGDTAHFLSEGEMTAVALLYFLKSLEDRQFDLKGGIVVLDDPVSSLDANALYLAFGFIRSRTQDAAQLFILTHDFSFFRQVRHWFHSMKGQKSRDISKHPARFYMLECTGGQDGRCGCIQPLDPLLEKYDSEYHYIFSRLYRASLLNKNDHLEENYIYPNMARRLLETFLAFSMPHIEGGLADKMQMVKFDEAKKLRILRFVHTYSHSSEMSEMEHDPSLLAEAPSVLADVMDLMEKLDSVHYSAMVKLVSPADDIEGAQKDD